MGKLAELFVLAAAFVVVASCTLRVVSNHPDSEVQVACLGDTGDHQQDEAPQGMAQNP